MATETKEVRIVYTDPNEVTISCTKAVGGKEATSVMTSPIANVQIHKGLVGTEKDITPATHIVPFAGCNYMGQCMVCVPTGTWNKNLLAEDTVNVVKRIPLVEDSEFNCTARGGKITFNFGASKTIDSKKKKPNIVDKAKAKINNTVNSVVKNATEVIQGISEGVTGALDGLESFVEGTQVASLANALDTQVQKLNELKKQADSRVEDLDNEIKELKKKIEAKLTGKEYEPPKEEENNTTTSTATETENSDASTDTTDKDKDTIIDLQNAEEEKRNEELYDQATNDAILEYENYLNTQITTTPSISESANNDASSESNVTISNNDKSTTETTIATDNNNSKSITKAEEENATTQYLNELTDTANSLGLEDNQDAQEALALLNNMNTILIDPAESVVNQVKDTVQIERNTLNNKVQAKIEEELKELGYYEKLKEYQKESKKLQDDIDKASLALKSVGDFGGFIDGLTEKYLGKAAEKYSKTLNKISNNLATLNTSLDGLSYVVDKCPKGDVVTNVVREIKESDNEDEDGGNNDGDSNSNIFGSLQDVLDDRNEEPKILRIYAVYVEDDEEGGTYKAGDIIQVNSILPDILVNLIIQSNGEANGAIVDLDLQERTFHYDTVNSVDRSNIRDGLFENITLKGDSPNFEKGGSYDLSDPNYALDPDGRRILSDKTIIEFKSRLPIEEQEEEL